jgi:hypothetical protein
MMHERIVEKIVVHSHFDRPLRHRAKELEMSGTNGVENGSVLGAMLGLDSSLCNLAAKEERGYIYGSFHFLEELW